MLETVLTVVEFLCQTTMLLVLIMSLFSGTETVRKIVAKLKPWMGTVIVLMAYAGVAFTVF